MPTKKKIIANKDFKMMTINEFASMYCRNEENKKHFSWRISYLKDIHPKFNLEEHRKKFKAVRSKEYGFFELKKQ